VGLLVADADAASLACIVHLSRCWRVRCSVDDTRRRESASGGTGVAVLGNRDGRQNNEACQLRMRCESSLDPTLNGRVSRDEDRQRNSARDDSVSCPVLAAEPYCDSIHGATKPLSVVPHCMGLKLREWQCLNRICIPRILEALPLARLF